MSYKGRYNPINPKKYRGNPNQIIYRSLWEKKVMVYCDKNDAILEWGSEEIIVPYLSPWDNKVHRYMIDNYIVFKDKEGKKNKILIEIKPSSQTKKPKQRKYARKKTILYERKMYVQNIAKWEAAKKYASKKGYKFIILTEKELNIRWK